MVAVLLGLILVTLIYVQRTDFFMQVNTTDVPLPSEDQRYIPMLLIGDLSTDCFMH